ncbi:acetyltransferase [Archaeoglobus sp.]
MKKYLIVGGGAQAKYIVDILTLRGEEIEGILDVENNKDYHGTKIGDVEVLGYYRELIRHFDPETCYVSICHSNNRLKEKLYYELKQLGYKFPKIIHPTAYISKYATLSEGCIINSHVSIMPFARIGRCVIVHSNCVIEHDCVVEDFVNIAPSATLAGYAKVGKRSYIYTNATLLPGVSIGDDVVVGAGAVVIRDVESGKVVKGVPAR